MSLFVKQLVTALGWVVEVSWEVAWGLGMVVEIRPVFRNFPLLSAAVVVVVILRRYPQDYRQFRTSHLVAVREETLVELWKAVEVASQGVCLVLVVIW